jgi:hypothetical protein
MRDADCLSAALSLRAIELRRNADRPTWRLKRILLAYLPRLRHVPQLPRALGAPNASAPGKEGELVENRYLAP